MLKRLLCAASCFNTAISGLISQVVLQQSFPKVMVSTEEKMPACLAAIFKKSALTGSESNMGDGRKKDHLTPIVGAQI